MSQIILQTFDFILSEQDRVYTLRKRPASQFIIALFALFGAALFGVVGIWLGSKEGEYHALGLLAKGFGELMAVLGILSLFIATGIVFSKRMKTVWTLDVPGKTLRFRKEIIPFAHLYSFEVVPSAAGYANLTAVNLLKESKLLMMLPASANPPAEELATRFNRFLVPEEAEKAAGSASHFKPFPFHMGAMVLVILGALWTVGGYFFFSGLYFTSRAHPDDSSIPVWSVGLLSLAFGLYLFWKDRK